MNSQPPPPLDSPDLQNPLECPPLKWGILGCGRVSHDFTQALKHLPTQKVVACSARKEESAKDFAEKHGIDRFYGGYDAMLQDDEVEIVYVGNVHSLRRETGEKCLLANKHVLLEKPFACSVKDGEYLIGLAKERNLFLLEGMWTRFFPAVQKARELALARDGGKARLGEIANLYSDFNFNAADTDPYPESFLFQRKLGGGAGLLVAPYPIAAATLFFGSAEPDSVKVVGQVDEATGVDLQGAMALSFPPTSKIQPATDPSNVDEATPKLPGAGVALLTFGMLAESAEETTVVGTKGRLTLKSPGHCPTTLVVEMKAEGRGSKSGIETYHYPLPEDTEVITKAGGYFYPNSAGFCYEAAAVARCIGQGKTETPQYTVNETLIGLKLMEEIRNQLGVKGIDE